MMVVLLPRVNCVYAVYGTDRCTNKNISKSLFGFGPRICKLSNPHDFALDCEHMIKHKAPVLAPPPGEVKVEDPPPPPEPPPCRIIKEDFPWPLRKKK